jgi:putative aldouronate transport system substrate-binding protein
VSENRIETIDPQGKASRNDVNNAMYGLTKWSLANTFNAYESQYDLVGWNEYLEKEVHAKAVTSPKNGFMVNTDPITMEITQVNAVIKEYENVLLSGAMADYMTRYDTFISKLKMAGVDKIVAEVQKQLDDWKKNK